ncbi:MAG TPA: hypothetical protein VEZ90_16420, partial [Blastocatellia bacterium]|nr:hypothetical protein [Blastocatellia bacterium]
PEPPTLTQSKLVLTDNGTSRYRALETTVNYRPRRNSNINFSYIRSDSRGDLNTFGANLATFEKNVVPPDRYALSRTDSPNRFLVWGDLSTFKGIIAAPAIDVHTGFPFAFFDADRHVPNETDFGRLPRTVSVDLGLYRDFGVRAFDRPGKLRVGVRVYNLTNHFNPRDAQLGENEEQSKPVLLGYLNNAGRTYRASLMFNF